MCITFGVSTRSEITVLAQEFLPSARGRLVPTVGGAVAFAPAPLPRRLDLSPRLVTLLGQADHEIGRLDGLGHLGFDPFLVGAPLLHREAIVSSRIEGTVTTPEDLALHEAGAALPEGHREGDAREVANYMRAMRHGLARLPELPLSLRLISELHAHLLEGVRGAERQPGEFRASQNYIGRPGITILEARFVPPPVPEMREALGDFEKYLHVSHEDEPDLPPILVRAALVHHQFETIHPFADGNGRVGRLLIPLQLIHEGRLHQPLFYMSAYFERHREAYYDGLLNACRTGEYLPWVEFFLRGVVECAREAIRQVERLIALRAEWHARFQTAGSSALLIRLVDRLFERPSVTANEIAAAFNVKHITATRNIEKLVEAGILTERTGRKRDRVFIAMPLLRLMDTEPESEANPAR